MALDASLSSSPYFYHGRISYYCGLTPLCMHLPKVISYVPVSWNIKSDQITYFSIFNFIVICFLWDILQLSSHFFWDLLDSIIVDVASECHRVARLGLDSNLEEEDEELKLSTQARVRVADPSNSNEANGKYVVDIFGQTHPSVANEIFECMNCGRSIMAGRFAPHLEKCMGKVILLSFRIVYGDPFLNQMFT